MDQYCSGNINSLDNNPIQQDPIGRIDLSTRLGSPSTIKAVQNWTKIFPIAKEYGVSLEKPALEFQPAALRYLYQQTIEKRDLPHNQFEQILGKTYEVRHVSPIVSVYVSRDPETDDQLTLVFVLKLCTCEACRNPAKIGVSQMKPSRARVTIKLPWRDNTIDLLLTFFPGVTSEFSMPRDVDLCDPSIFLFYTNRHKMRSLELIPFNRFENVLHRVLGSLQEEEEQRLMEEWTTPEIEERAVVRQGMNPPHSGKMFLLPDMELKSSDGERFACHSRVISAQGNAGEITPVGENQMLLVEVSGDADITKAFIQWIYFHDDNLLASLNFKGRIQLLNLACQFKIVKLMGIVSKMLMLEMDDDDFSWENEDMWRLYCVVRTVDKIQIVVRLKEKVKVKTRVQKLQQQNKSFRSDDGDGYAAYMDHFFFKMLLELIEKDGGDGAMVKFL